ncbi:MAG TPA: hypothetical protein VED20_13560, partial [Streptosporangiaceae bacterium]|nr:hypothetical protein [Streptosporangiaceae bacterium]
MDYHQHDLTLVHARGYGQHADNCAPGIPALLAGHGVDAAVRSSFGIEELPPGLHAVTGVRRCRPGRRSGNR